jgi:hypothetical protein
MSTKKDESLGLKKKEGNNLVAASRRVFIENVIVF